MESISVEQAAREMKVDVSTVRFGLQQNRFPFGTAVECTKSWRYIIYPEIFRQYYPKSQ